MRKWTLTVSSLGLAVMLAGCSKSEPETPAPAPAPKTEAKKPAQMPPPTSPTVTPPTTAFKSLPKVTDEGEENVPALENAYISTPDFTARVEAIYRLADVGSPEAISSLGRLFQMEKDPDLKTEILDSLFDIDGHDQLKAALLAAGAGTDQPKEVRQSAVDGLEDIKPEIAIPILRALTSDQDEEIRESAKDAIEMLQDMQSMPGE